MKIRRIASPGWLLFFLMLPPLIGVVLPILLPIIQAIRNILQG